MNDHLTVLGGKCSARFEPLRELFAANIKSGEDLGVSLALQIDGEMVVDVWDGWSDEARTVPWTENMITNVFSTTKSMTPLTALVLVDRGELDLDAMVAKYWPEFAANVKTGITVRHLLSHTSGDSGWEQPITLEDLYIWDKSTALVATQEPWWEPGTASGYHAMTYGNLIGEEIRSITWPGIPSKWGVGYSVAPEGRVCAFGGAGNSLVVIDADRRITFAYAMSKMAPGSGTITVALAEQESEIVKSTNPS